MSTEGSKRPSVHRTSLHGFSLIEVTLAIGILAFAFLSVFGLLSASMNLARDSMNRTHLSRITQRLVAMAQQTPFDKQSALVGTIYRFDGDGELLGTGSSGDFVYTATLLNLDAATLQNETDLGIPNKTTRMLAVKIAVNRLVTDNDIPSNKQSQFSFALADMAL